MAASITFRTGMIDQKKLLISVNVRISVWIKWVFPKKNCEGNSKNYLQKPGKRRPSRNSKLFCNNNKFRLQKLLLRRPRQQPRQPAQAAVIIIQMVVLTRHE